MALFAIQLVRLVLYILPTVQQKYLNLVIGINEMFNVKICFISTYFIFLLINIYLATTRASHQQ